MKEPVARGISFVFHPLLMTSVGFLIIFHSGTSLSVLQDEVIKMSMIVIGLFTFIFPALTVLFLYLTKVVNELEFKEKKARLLPIALTAVMYLFTFFILRSIPQLTRVHIYFFACTPAILVLLLAMNNSLCPSIHMAGTGFLTGVIFILILFFGADMQGLFMVTVIGAGILGTSRIILGERWEEVVTGFFTGFLPPAIIMTIYLI